MTATSYPGQSYPGASGDAAPTIAGIAYASEGRVFATAATEGRPAGTSATESAIRATAATD